MYFFILFYRMNLMCFADCLDSLLLIFCSFCSFCPYYFILFLFNTNVLKNAFDSKINDSNPKHFFVFDFHVSNKISSTPTRLLIFQEFSNPSVYFKPTSVYYLFQPPTPSQPPSIGTLDYFICKVFMLI